MQIKCLCTGVCFLADIANPLPRVFSSIYKDSNTLHLPTERFSPVRRFSDGAASIQAFKAHLEKMGNNSSIKQLQQVRERGGGPRKSPREGFLLSQPCCFRAQKVQSFPLVAVDARWPAGRGAAPLCASAATLLSVLYVHALFTRRLGTLGASTPPPSGEQTPRCAHVWGGSACPRGSHRHCQTAAAAALPHFPWQRSFGAVPGCPGKRAAPTARVWSVLYAVPYAASARLYRWLEWDLAPGWDFRLATG